MKLESPVKIHRETPAQAAFTDVLVHWKGVFKMKNERSNTCTYCFYTYALHIYLPLELLYIL